MTTTGYNLLAEALARQGVKHAYGIVGIPVIELGFALQAQGVNYYGFRNQQQASYSAGITGYLTGMPAICLCVSGPGHTNAVSGLANAWSNGWPMILISGASDISQEGRGAFQEANQIDCARPFCKAVFRVIETKRIPYFAKEAVRLSITGRPGPVYLQLPGDILNESLKEDSFSFEPKVVLSLAGPDPSAVSQAVQAIKKAKSPLLIFGKGAAYARVEDCARQLVASTNIPFLPTPMGKGVVQDSHPLNASPARSTALGEADLIVLVGARVNWILHFGLPPRFKKDVRVVQLDIDPLQVSKNHGESIVLCGHLQLSLPLLAEGLKGWRLESGPWHKRLNQKCIQNQKSSKKLIEDKSLPMNYYSVFGIVKKWIGPEDYLVAEGANTMDIGRTVFAQEQPRTRLDAASFGTMGIGLPSIISAKSVHPGRRVVATMGDSAFGFSGMECETLTRYKMGAVLFIINNNGIYSGVDQLPDDPLTSPVTALNPGARYQIVAEAFGGKGFEVTSHEQLDKVCQVVFGKEYSDKLVIVNVRINPSGQKKPQQHMWLTREEPKAKL